MRTTVDDDEKPVFEALKAHEGWYFVEYTPPQPWMPLATLTLTVLDDSAGERVAIAVEDQLRVWLRRYPVPTVASACDTTDTVIRLEEVRGFSQAAGWLDASTGTVAHRWKTTSPTEMPPLSIETAALRHIFADVPLRPRIPREQTAIQRRWLVRAAKVLAFVWVVGIPLGIWLLDGFGPPWVTNVMALYTAAIVYVAALKFLGWWPKTSSDLVSEEEESSRRHHHDVCKRNPEGFARLRAETFQRDQREATLREAEELRRRG